MVHWREKRALTVAEGKRLQSFPDQFRLKGTYSQAWRQVGNAVPPLMMEAIARHVREAILCVS